MIMCEYDSVLVFLFFFSLHNVVIALKLTAVIAHMYVR